MYLVTNTLVIHFYRVKPIMATSVVLVNPEPAEIELTYQASPFQMNLCDVTDSVRQNLESGVKVITSAQQTYWFAYFWGVNIQSFHQAMLLSWQEMKQKLLDGTLFTCQPLESSEPELCYETEREVLLKPTKVTAQDLGQSPRAQFPLVVAMILQSEDDISVNQTDTVALISAIHVQDRFCTSDTSFVFKLSKLAGGQVLNVSNLFTRDNTEESTICLVCEGSRVTIGLLPCRHFSLCEVCYNKLPLPKRCPVCRSFVAKFFRHKELAGAQNSIEEEINSAPHGDSNFSSPENASMGNLPAPSNWFGRQMRRIFRTD